MVKEPMGIYPSKWYMMISMGLKGFIPTTSCQELTSVSFLQGS